MLDTGFRRLLLRVGRELTADQHILLRRHLDRLEDERATDLAIGERDAGHRRCPADACAAARSARPSTDATSSVASASSVRRPRAAVAAPSIR